MKKRAGFRAVSLLIAAAVAGTAAYVYFNGGPDDRSASVVEISGAERFFARNLRDWVSFGDSVVLVTVVSERRVELTKEEAARGEGYVAREVTVAVEQVVWDGPLEAALPKQIAFFTAGSVVRDGREIPTRIHGAPRLEVGQRALVPLLRVAGEGWLPMSPASVLLIDDETGRAVAEPSTEAVTALNGLQVNEIAGLLSSTPPFPEVEKASQLDSVERMRLVYGDFESGASVSVVEAESVGSP